MNVNQNFVIMFEMVPVVCPLWLVRGAQCVLAPAVDALGQAVVVLTGVSFLLHLLQIVPWRVVFLQLRDL